MSVWRGNDGRRIEVHFGTSNASGLMNVTYATPFPTGKPPAVIPAMIGATNARTVRVVSSTEAGFSVICEDRTVVTILSIQVISSAATPAAGQSLTVTVVEDE